MRGLETTTSLDSREVQTKTVDPDPEQEGEEGEVITTTTEYYTNLDKVHLYGASGIGAEITTGVNKNGVADGIGTFELTDTRDSKTYLTRRLADGNCWMAQNLALDLATSGTLTTESTDLSSDWDPYERVGKNDFALWSRKETNNSLCKIFNVCKTRKIIDKR